MVIVVHSQHTQEARGTESLATLAVDPFVGVSRPRDLPREQSTREVHALLIEHAVEQFVADDRQEEEDHEEEDECVPEVVERHLQSIGHAHQQGGVQYVDHPNHSQGTHHEVLVLLR